MAVSPYIMPYSTPASPMPSPAKETAPKSKKGFYTPPTHVEDIVSGPMPGIPRRASSRTTSPAMSRSASSSHQPFTASRPVDGLPRRSSHTPTQSSITGLPDGGSLGLKLHGSPTRAPDMTRGAKDSMSSTSTMESSLPPTPKDEPLELDAMDTGKREGGIPFPPFNPVARPISSRHPLRTSMAPQRPTLSGRQHSHSGGHHGRGQGSLQLSMPGSASTSHLTESPADARPTRPSAMIRKKSGEVVKPSLKQRSMSTPDLTRQAENSPPLEQQRTFGEERSKSVRFADSDDTPGSMLNNVVLFLQNQKPAAVSKAADPDGHLTETETEGDTDASDFVQFRTRKNAAARAVDDARDIQLEGGSRVPRVRCDFAPGALNGEMVVMERAELKSVNGSLCLQGTVIVRNVAFQKWVAIRFTMDHWQTVSEVSGSHVTHVPSSTTGDEGWDRFSFNIKLEDYRRKLDERQLLMCIRFSVEGQEWWDSNNGLNYSFGFKRSSPKQRNRRSLPPSFTDRFNADSGSITSLPGLRQNPKGNFAPSNRIAQSFGDKSRSSGARDWSFPTFGNGSNSGSRPDSPALSPPPVTAFRPPNPPDVHTHLHLTSYCAPSPPMSPPADSPGSPPTSSMLLGTGSTYEGEPKMSIVGGHPATILPPGHERRSSWSGKHGGSWDSFAQVMDDLDSSDGNITPRAHGSRSPSGTPGQDAGSPTPTGRPLTMKRSTGNLQALRNGEIALPTPPSSLSPSPSPNVIALPLEAEVEPMSPQTSNSTTGDSSPINTLSPNSPPDVTTLHIEVDPARMQGGSVGHRLLNNESYDEFLKKFCFFQSPRATPNTDDLPVVRNNYVHVSGHSSPNGFPFYSSQPQHGRNSRDTPTPKREYDSAGDAFRFSGQYAQSGNSGHQTPSTPRPSAGHSASESRSGIPPNNNGPGQQ